MRVTLWTPGAFGEKQENSAIRHGGRRLGPARDIGTVTGQGGSGMPHLHDHLERPQVKRSSSS